MPQAQSVPDSRNTVLPCLQPRHHRLTAPEQVEMLVLVLQPFEIAYADPAHWVARQVLPVEGLVYFHGKFDENQDDIGVALFQDASTY